MFKRDGYESDTIEMKKTLFDHSLIIPNDEYKVVMKSAKNIEDNSNLEDSLFTCDFEKIQNNKIGVINFEHTANSTYIIPSIAEGILSQEDSTIDETSSTINTKQ